MSYTDNEGPWLTISEAAERTGRKIDAMRALVRRGRLPRRKGNRGEWLVQLPETVTPAGRDTDLGTVSDGALGTELAALREQVTRLRLDVMRTEGELAAVRAVAEANAAAADRLLAERAATIAELKAERDRLLGMLGEAQAALAHRRQGMLAQLWDRLFGSRGIKQP
jgi:hypothetical protein